jgi:hypothetical protein
MKQYVLTKKVKKFKVHPEHWNKQGQMDCLMGKTIKVTKAINRLWCDYICVEDDICWGFKKSDFIKKRKPV